MITGMPLPHIGHVRVWPRYLSLLRGTRLSDSIRSGRPAGCGPTACGPRRRRSAGSHGVSCSMARAIPWRWAKAKSPGSCRRWRCAGLGAPRPSRPSVCGALCPTMSSVGPWAGWRRWSAPSVRPVSRPCCPDRKSKRGSALRKVPTGAWPAPSRGPAGACRSVCVAECRALTSRTSRLWFVQARALRSCARCCTRLGDPR